MHIQTHVMSGWCVGNCFRLTGRERLWCMLAASLPALDGLGVLVSQEAYWDYHHKVGHNLLAGGVLAGILTAFSTNKVKARVLFLGLFHLHLVLDFFGSGPGWPIHYGWPFSSWEFEFRHAWPFYSWQNISAGGACLVWTLVIARRWGRTPLEVLMPGLNMQLARAIRTATVNSARQE